MSSARSDFDTARDPNISLEYSPLARELCDRWRRAAIFDGSPDQELRWCAVATWLVNNAESMAAYRPLNFSGRHVTETHDPLVRLQLEILAEQAEALARVAITRGGMRPQADGERVLEPADGYWWACRREGSDQDEQIVELGAFGAGLCVDRLGTDETLSMGEFLDEYRLIEPVRPRR